MCRHGAHSWVRTVTLGVLTQWSDVSAKALTPGAPSSSPPPGPTLPAADSCSNEAHRRAPLRFRLGRRSSLDWRLPLAKATRLRSSTAFRTF
ncbi:hypothetical protein MTO96_002634 [Rhipicephalus appendiculatus]